MAELTPHAIIETLSSISKQLDDKADEIEKLDEIAVRARAKYKRNYAEAFLRAEGANDIRKYTAELATSQDYLEAELADQVLRAARESIWILRDRLKVGQSVGAMIRTEWGVRE